MTSQTFSSFSFARPTTSWPAAIAHVARRLIAADARARNRRHVEDLPDWLRADAGLPQRSNTERAVRDHLLRAIGRL
jgi:hypothetical protein